MGHHPQRSKIESIFLDATQGITDCVTADEDRVFIWQRGQNPEQYTIYRVSDDAKRSADDIPSEEIINAVKEVLSQQISLSESDLIRETAKKLGYSRTVGVVESTISFAVRKGVSAGKLTRAENGYISAAQ